MADAIEGFGAGRGSGALIRGDSQGRSSEAGSGPGVSMLRELARKFRRRAAGIGTWNTLLYALKRVLRRLPLNVRLVKYILHAQPVTEQSALGDGRSGYRVVEVGQEDYDLTWFPRPAEVIEARYRQGASCLVAMKGEQPVGCLWLHLGDYQEDEVRSLFCPRPKPLCAWDFDVYVAPDYRLSRAFMLLWDAANQRLREQGFQWVMSRIDAFNETSLRSHTSLKAAPVGSVSYLLVGAWQMTVSSRPPFLHFSFNHQQRPRIVVSPPGGLGDLGGSGDQRAG